MPDIAELGIKVTTQGVDQAGTGLKTLETNAKGAETATQRLQTSVDGLSGILGQLAGYFAALKLGEFAKDAAFAAARYETLGVVLKLVGENMGYAQSQTNKYAKDLQSQGISMLESRQQLSRMAMSGLPLDRAGELGSAAQNAAVIAGTNSSEAFDRLVHGIVSGQSEVLRTMGIMADFEGEMSRLQKATGKTSQEFTKQELIVARMNAVLTSTKNIAGVYEAAMTTAGKAMTSMVRYWENLKVVLGQAFQEGLTNIIKDVTQAMKDLAAVAEKDDFRQKLAGIASTAYETVKSLMGIGKELGGVFLSALSVWNQLPPFIQEVGLVGALLGGTKWKLILLTAASIMGSMEKIATVMAAVDRGEIEEGYTAKFSREALEDQRKRATDESLAGLQRRLAAVRKNLDEGVGRDEYDRNSPRRQRMLQAEKELQDKIAALQGDASGKKVAQDRLDRESEARAAQGRIGAAQREADEEARIRWELGKKIAAAQKALDDARSAQLVQGAKQSGSAVRQVEAEDAAARIAAEGDLRGKLADKDRTRGEKALDQERHRVLIETLDQAKKYNLEEAQIKDEKLRNDAAAQRASVAGVQNYYTQLEKIRLEYRANVLKNPSSTGLYGEIGQRAIEELTRNTITTGRQGVAGIRGQLAGVRADLAGLSGSGVSPQGRVDLQVIQMQAEAQQKMLELEKQHDDLVAARTEKKAGVAAALQAGDESAAAIAQQDLDLTQERIDATEELIKLTDRLHKGRQKELQESRTLTGGLTKAMDDYYDKVSNTGANVASAFNGVMNGMENSLVQFFDKGKLGWREFGAVVRQELIKMYVKEALMAPFMSMMKAGGGIANLWGLLSANGNVFGPGGVHAFANGGTFTNSIVSSPTLFRFANGTGLMGEDGPEAIVPLARNSRGQLGVHAQMEAAAPVINMEVKLVNQSGSKLAPVSKKVQWSNDMRDAVVTIVVDDIDSGGPIGRKLGM